VISHTARWYERYEWGTVSAKVSPDDVARWVLHDDRASEEALGRAYEAMEADPDLARDVLDRLLRHRNKNVRSWATMIGGDLFKAGFTPRLLRMVKDRDEEVRSIARMQLQQYDRPALASMAEELRSKLLATEDDDEGRQLSSLLGEMRDRDSIAALRSVASRPSTGWGARRLAGAFIVYIEEGAEGVLRRIREHSDHELMHGLVPIAYYTIGTEEAREALSWCASNAHDERCRSECAAYLNIWDQRPPRELRPPS
jgi:HEAT repeat protein